MGLTIQQEDGSWVLRITGVLRKAELDNIQDAATKLLAGGATVKLLIIAEDFGGWERGPDWGDVSFFLEHGDKIDKIAVVAEPKWKTEWLAFAGAGFRRAPVKYFAPNQLADACAWLA